MKSPDLAHAVFDGIDTERLEAARSMTAAFTKADLAAWTGRRIVTDEIRGQRFRMVVDRGEDLNRVIVVGGEYGNGLGALGAVARARIVRQVVDPSASLVLQPNTALGDPNSNFSKTERNLLRQGIAQPLVDRIRATLEALGSPNKMTLYGPSQGGTTMLALAAHISMPPTATAIMETPNVTDRSYIGVAKDFIGAGADLKATISANFESSTTLGEELVADLSVRGLAKYAAGLALPDNLALLGIIRRATAQKHMEAILVRGGSVAHAWALGDKVSPASANNAIASSLAVTYPGQYAAYSFEGDHSFTNAYFSNAALVAQSQRLLDNRS